MSGRLIGVGVGPGDPELLTLKATRMLAGLPLAETALACGFADQSHMTRAFRKAFGLPPGRWQELRLAASDARGRRAAGARR